MQENDQNIPPKSEKSSLFLFLLLLAAVVYFLSVHAKVTMNIVIVAIGFGSMIMVHEIGHFVVAKLCKIKVFAFSIGMPWLLLGLMRTEKGYRLRILPKLRDGERDDEKEAKKVLYFGKGGKEWETEYCIGAIPFGGFVKMLGQDDIGAVKKSSDPGSYMNKPALARLAVLAAGVSFNILMAVVLFIVAFGHGIDLQPPVVGDVMEGSPAARAGLQAGDEFVSIDGRKWNLDYFNVAVAAALSDPNEKVHAILKREDGSLYEVDLVAEEVPGANQRLFGIVPPTTLSVADIKEPKKLKQQTGLEPGDVIVGVDGKSVDRYVDYTKVVENTFKPTVQMHVERGGEQVAYDFELAVNVMQQQWSGERKLTHLYSMVPRILIADVTKQQQENKQGLRKGDVIARIGEVRAPNFYELREVTEKYADQVLEVEVLRKGDEGDEDLLTLKIVPKYDSKTKKVRLGFVPVSDMQHAVVASIEEVDGVAQLQIPKGATVTAVNGQAVNSYYDIVQFVQASEAEEVVVDWRLREEQGTAVLDVSQPGVEYVNAKSFVSANIPLEPQTRVYKAGSAIEGLKMGLDRMLMFVGQAYMTLKSLFVGSVGTETLTGPIGLLKLSYDIVANRPIVYYVYIMGLINSMIAVFNFLPIVPFDGGFAVLTIIEKIKGSPLSEKTQLVLGNAGLFLIIALFLYLTFNDLFRPQF